MLEYEPNIQIVLNKLDEIKDYVRDQNIEIRNEISAIQARCVERKSVYEKGKRLFDEPLLPWIDTASMWFGRFMWAALIFYLYNFLDKNYLK